MTLTRPAAPPCGGFTALHEEMHHVGYLILAYIFYSLIMIKLLLTHFLLRKEIDYFSIFFLLIHFKKYFLYNFNKLFSSTIFFG